MILKLLKNSTRNLSYTLSVLGEIFDNINKILKENRKNIYQPKKQCAI